MQCESENFESQIQITNEYDLMMIVIGVWIPIVWQLHIYIISIRLTWLLSQ